MLIIAGIVFTSKFGNVWNSRIEEEQDSVDDLIDGSDSDGKVQVLQVMKVNYLHPRNFF
jgi:hypothetical protein